MEHNAEWKGNSLGWSSVTVIISFPHSLDHWCCSLLATAQSTQCQFPHKTPLSPGRHFHFRYRNTHQRVCFFPQALFLVGRRKITRDGRKGRQFPISFSQPLGVCGTLECLMGEMLAILISLLQFHYIRNHNSHPEAAVTGLSPSFELFIYYSIIAKTDLFSIYRCEILYLFKLYHLPLPPDHRIKEEFVYWRKGSYQAAKFSLSHTQPWKSNFVDR